MQSFKHYSGKSMIIMIALAVVLVLSLLNIFTSLQKTAYLRSVSQGGDAHFKFSGVNAEQTEELKQNEAVEWIVKYSFSNTMIIEGQNGKTAGIVYLENFDTMDWYTIKKGALPVLENEIVVSESTAKFLGFEARIGEEVAISLQKYNYVDENIVDISEIPMKFIIAGIVYDNYNFEIAENNFVFVSKAFLSETDKKSFENNTELLIHIKKGYDTTETAKLLAESIGLDNDNINYNHSYLLANLDKLSDKIIISVLILFVVLIGSLIIYNAFNIIISKRTRHYGLLTLLGASKKQIIQCVYTETLLNIITALPIGLIAGTFASRIVLPVVNKGFGGISTVFSLDIKSYIVTSVVTVIMVFAGTMLPAGRAGKTTPVEAAKFSSNNVKTNKKIKEIKTDKKISLSLLARLNMFRQNNGVKGTIISLSLVGSLFVGTLIVCFITYDSLGNLTQKNMPMDIKISMGKREENGALYYNSGWDSVLNDKVVNKILNIEGVKKSTVFYAQTYSKTDEISEYPIIGKIICTEDDFFKELLKEPSGSNLKFSDFVQNPSNALITEDIFYNENGSESEKDTYHSDEILTVNLNDYFGDSSITGQISLNILGEIKSLYKYGIGSILPCIIMPKSSFEANGLELQCESINLNIEYSKHESIIKELEAICFEEGNIHYESAAEIKKLYQNQVTGIMILIFGALGIIFLVSVINLISSKFISIEQRKKELGILSAIGLGHADLGKMLKWEGIWVSVISTVSSVGIGMAGGYGFIAWLYNIDKDSYFRFSFPALPMIIFCIIYIFTPLIISEIAVYKLLKNTTAELMTKEI